MDDDDLQGKSSKAIGQLIREMTLAGMVGEPMAGMTVGME
jgi:hypothetical protein